MFGKILRILWKGFDAFVKIPIFHIHLKGFMSRETTQNDFGHLFRIRVNSEFM